MPATSARVAAAVRIVKLSAAVTALEALHTASQEVTDLLEKNAERVLRGVTGRNGPVSAAEESALLRAMAAERQECEARIAVLDARAKLLAAFQDGQKAEAARHTGGVVNAAGSRVLVTPEPEPTGRGPVFNFVRSSLAEQVASDNAQNAARNAFASGPHAVGTGG